MNGYPTVSKLLQLVHTWVGSTRKLYTCKRVKCQLTRCLRRYSIQKYLNMVNDNNEPLFCIRLKPAALPGSTEMRWLFLNFYQSALTLNNFRLISHKKYPRRMKQSRRAGIEPGTLDLLATSLNAGYLQISIQLVELEFLT